METQKLWKVVVEAQLEMDEIERAVAEVPGITEPTLPTRGVELQRIDVVDGRSIVFVTGSDKSARALEGCLKISARGQQRSSVQKRLRVNSTPASRRRAESRSKLGSA